MGLKKLVKHNAVDKPAHADSKERSCRKERAAVRVILLQRSIVHRSIVHSRVPLILDGGLGSLRAWLCNPWRAVVNYGHHARDNDKRHHHRKERHRELTVEYPFAHFFACRGMAERTGECRYGVQGGCSRHSHELQWS